MKKQQLKSKGLILGAFLALALPMGTVRAEVVSQVLKVNLKLTEKQVAAVNIQGLLENKNPLPIRDVQVRVKLLNPNNEMVRSFLLKPFEHVSPEGEQLFQADYVLRDYDALYLKAVSEVAYVSTSYLQVADWILTENWRNLEIWRIPVSVEAKSQERARIELALDYLERVEPIRPEYAESREKWNLIQYTYGKRLAESQDGHEAILRLSNVEPGSAHVVEAQALIENVRVETLYKRAMQKAVAGNVEGAFRQMLYVPSGHVRYAQAQEKIAEWREILQSSKAPLYWIEPPSDLSGAQRSHWLRQHHGAEGYTSSARPGGQKLRTMWYLDYSHATYDAQRRLLNKREF